MTAISDAPVARPIADPINLYDARNEDHAELAPGASFMEWLAEHLPAMIFGALCGALAVAVPAIVVAWIVR